MTKAYHFIAFMTLWALVYACGTDKGTHEKSQTKLAQVKAMRRNIKNTVDLDMYDQYTRVYRKAKGTLISGNIVVAPFDAVRGSYSVKMKFLGREVEPMSGGYLHYDFKSNMVYLNVTGSAQAFAPMAPCFNDKGLYTLSLQDGQITKSMLTVLGTLTSDSLSYVTVSKKVAAGTSLFNANHQLVGVFNNIKFKDKDTLVVVPIERVLAMLPAKGAKKKAIGNLRLTSDKVYTPAEKVTGFKVETSMGNFTIKVYNDLPEYKENMIKLVEDGYYDSLLVHRVIYKFLMQTGAADTKYAKAGDPVGYRGPGYMLPTIIKPKYIHKRGAVAMSKPPDYKNPKNKTSGSQFYIIGGRTFDDGELDDYQAQKNFKYTAKQRNLYKTVGGAAYLDADYAVIGEVTSGMATVDRITMIPVGKDERPVKDVRIKHIRVLKR